jgi:toxin-antitoxin system PIN domain toxin
VTLPDTNIWLALALSTHGFHEAARRWFDRQSADASVLFCRATQQSLLRLLTTDAVMRPHGIPPMTNAAAWQVYQAFLSDRRIAWAPEPDADDVTARWNAFAARATASPKLWMDAYLAAFAMAGRCRLVTTDKGFEQFQGLDPIVLTSTAAKP